MRPGAILRLLALIAVGLSLAFGAVGLLSFRSALAAKIDRSASIEKAAARPAAAARLAAALLEKRLASVTETPSKGVASAFRHAEGSKELADYRAAGGDPAIASEAQKALAAPVTQPQSDIALMRAIRGLRSDADRLPRPSAPPAPPQASSGGFWIAVACGCSALAALLGYAAGRSARNS